MRTMLEVMAPQRRATPEAIAAAVERIGGAAKKLRHIDYLNVPEVLEENYAGVPLYKHLDVVEFAAELQRSSGIRVVANKAVVYLESEAAFSNWLDGCVSKRGLHSFVFVGGNSHSRKYPGPAVTKADEIAAKIDGVEFGNISIPSRAGEAERLVAKTRSGASFFTTQLLFEAGHISALLEDYDSKCMDAGLKPAAFFMSIAPVVSPYDLDFFRWLGAVVPDSVEAMLDDSFDTASASIGMSMGVFSEISAFAKRRKLKSEIGINVEAVSNANFDAACRLLRAINEKYR